jgi:hypothetical protein
MSGRASLRSRPASRPRRAARWTARVLLGAVLVGLVSLNVQCSSPLLVPPLRATDRPLVVDGDLELARRYAPFVYHAIDDGRGRQDLPTRVDFDGDLRGDNNWEHMPACELPPTLYYAVLTTATHHFLAYHVFHPRDWAPIDLGLHMTHENDGENLQVVVDRASGEVVLLFTQAHYEGGVYAPAGRDGEELAPGARWAARGDPIRGPLLLVDDEGRPDPRGRHAAVFVEDEGHGIFGVTDPDSEVSLRADGTADFEASGLVFRPARAGEAVSEPALPHGRTSTASAVPYQLESTTAKLWPGLRDGSLVGEDGLFDGALRYRGRLIDVGVPRYYEGDRFSGPFGADRGIAPFAVDFRFGEGEVGALFFDPAARYAECLTVPQPWSLEYEAYPFSLAR